MNKQLLTLLSIVVVAAIVAVIAFTVAPRKVATSGAKTASALENSGKYDEAMSAYGSALVKLSEGRRFTGIPDKTTAVNLNPQTWEKPIADFVDWLNVDKKIPAEISSLIEGLDRCMSKVKYENYVYDVKMKKASQADYKALAAGVLSKFQLPSRHYRQGIFPERRHCDYLGKLNLLVYD